MISVLIPVFNTDVTRLVRTLHRQLAAQSQPFELLIFDDGSQTGIRDTNLSLHELSDIRYLQALKNGGRIQARSALAELAHFDWLLFLDADSTIPSDNFIEKYLRAIPSVPSVVVGGRIYKAAPPTDCRLRLHWKYGFFKESKAADLTHPYRYFMTNNFLIHRTIFQQLAPPAYLEGYGHEDTMMGQQLERLGVAVTRINNPVVHEGLEEAAVFLRKTENALQNLVRLYRADDRKWLEQNIRLIAVYQRLQRWGLTKLVRKYYQWQKKRLQEQLTGCDPSLRNLALYKLGYFIELMRQQRFGDKRQ